MRRRIGPAAALLLALAACGGGGGTPDPSPTTSAPSTPAATSTASPTTTPTGPRCPLPTPPAAGATVVSATVEGGRVTTDQRRYDVRRDSPVRITVTADVADEVHVHGYDLKAKTTPGCPVSIDFTARIPGSVEVELERSRLELFELRAR